jgi:hypothetical protein
MAFIDALARQNGYLEDYPDQTEIRNKNKIIRRLRATGVEV